MSIRPENLSILHYPADSLRAKAAPIERVTDEVRSVVGRMVDLMYDAEGIGLAAPQVGVSWRLFVLDVPPTEDDERSIHAEPPTATPGPMAFINPRIEKYIGPPIRGEEGCLSLPEIRGEVLRPPEVIVRALDAHGDEFTFHAAGLLARCIQHENDHLDGVLIMDRFTQVSRLKTRGAIRELERAVRFR